MSTFYILSAIGFLSVGVYRYLISTGWDVVAFVKQDFRLMLKNGLMTTLLTYFAHDLVALLPTDIMGVSLNASDTLERAPKLAGFAIGAIGGGSDVLMVLRNVLELVPVIGPKLIKVFEGKKSSADDGQ